MYLTSPSASLKVSNDSGSTTALLTAGIESAEPASLVIDPANPSRMYMVGQPNYVAFATKITGAGGAIAYSTFLGGPLGTDSFPAAGIAALDVGPSGDLIVAGDTKTRGFPVTPSALQPAPPLADTVNFSFIARISESTLACTVVLSPNDIVTGAEDGRAIFSVIAPSGCAWSASSNQGWARIFPASGTGTGNISVLLDPFLGSVMRSATITVNGLTRKITQTGGSCPNSFGAPTLPVSGGPFSVPFNADSGCAWQFVNLAPNSITLTSPDSGTGSGAVFLTATANSGPVARAIPIVINSKLRYAAQGANSTCSYTLGATTLSVGATYGSGSVVISAPDGGYWNYQAPRRRPAFG